jgi:hypothetical protein
MNDPTQFFRQIISSANVAKWITEANAHPWKISVGTYPSAPDQIVLLNESGGRNPMPQWLVNYPSVQVQVRGNQTGYESARTKMKECVNAVLGIAPGVVVAGDTLQSVIQMGGILFLGRDDGNRPMFSANFSLIVLPAQEAGSHRLPIT